MTVRRALHDAFHIALIPFTALIVFGLVNATARSWIERVDLVVHIMIVFLAFDSIRDWAKARKPIVRAFNGRVVRDIAFERHSVGSILTRMRYRWSAWRTDSAVIRLVEQGKMTVREAHAHLAFSKRLRRLQ